MEKLTLEILSGYLSHGLKVSTIHKLHANNGIGSIHHIIDAVNKGTTQYKPILRPLSDLTKEIEHNGEKFIPMNVINELRAYHFYYVQYEDDKAFDCDDGSYYGVTELPYDVVQKLLSWHFDIHNLIEKGLAVDINMIQS